MLGPKMVLTFLFAIFVFGSMAEVMSCDPPPIMSSYPRICWKDAMAALLNLDDLRPLLIVAVLVYLLVALERWNATKFEVKK